MRTRTCVPTSFGLDLGSVGRVAQQPLRGPNRRRLSDGKSPISEFATGQCPRPKNEKKAVPDSGPGGGGRVGGIKDDTCCVGYSARVEEGGQVAAYSLQ